MLDKQKDLQFADLSYMNLIRANLIRVNLINADLYGAIAEIYLSNFERLRISCSS
ncbi:pentapeptide repeat-containing protein [Dolichospermum circinale CS-541/04]|nr:pentapeptide repeat-containing protein [Dolichospermum circinale]MDB9463870.1 pentapeptide repeat-containing protein [Dolichospermum circinale CS-541/04]MDB9548131.1 pentapeptide repeat-containing protein [Dolichospermum circinale CS-1031]